MEDEDLLELTEDLSVGDVLESREELVRILTEQGITNDQVLIKRLMNWKFDQADL